MISTVKKSKPGKKNRTTARPVLSQQLVHARPSFLPIGYVCLLFILFQWISIQQVSGFSEKPVASTLSQTIAAAPKKAPTAIGLPMRLTIPRLKVNAVVGAVGLLADGSMGVPKLPRDTAWYKLGTRPGEKGSAVIAGHVNWWNGTTAVFARLRTLKPGDTITVQDDAGAAITFKVRESRWYAATADATDIFTSHDGKAHLNLITCDGLWSRLTRQYSKRLVVFTDRVAE